MGKHPRVAVRSLKRSRRATVLPLVLALTLGANPADAAEASRRFLGNGYGSINRVKIWIDHPDRRAWTLRLARKTPRATRCNR